MDFLQQIWRRIQAQREASRSKRQGAQLEHQVQRRKGEAARCGISDLLIRIMENGRDYEPWLTDYDSQSSGAGSEATTFNVNGKPYTLTLIDLGLPAIGEPDAEQIQITLEQSGRRIYEARINRSCRLHGGMFSSGKPWEVLAYVPGNWVEEFNEVLEKVDRQREEEHFKKQHSPNTLDDLRRRFGL